MPLSKSEVYAVRYQLKKIDGLKATSQEIQDAAEFIKTTDSLAIAKFISQEKFALAPQETKIEVKPVTDSNSKLTLVEKKSLVASTAKDLDIELTVNEIGVIAKGIQTRGATFNSTLADVRDMILAFVAHKNLQENELVRQTQREISTALQEYDQAVNERIAETNQFFASLAEEQEKKTQAQVAASDKWLTELRGILKVP